MDEKIRDIAVRLRKIRELKQMTREQFCEPLGINSEYWGLIERGEQAISLTKLLQVCTVYEIPVESVIQMDPAGTDTSRLQEEVAALLNGRTERRLEVIKKFILEIAMML